MEITCLKESLFNGMSANAFKLGTVLTAGWFWFRTGGCSTLYRGGSMETIDFENILAVANTDVGEISPPTYVQHDNETIYFYVVRRFNGCGYQERTLEAAAKVSIDSTGDLRQPEPNDIIYAKVARLADNKILIGWYYCPLEQKSKPINFKVYYDNRTGQVDYENAIAEISCAGKGFYSYQSNTLNSGIYLFTVRVVDAMGTEDESSKQLKIYIDANTPNGIEILNIETI